jgi:predicted nucleotidyltransferase component of viral defense system
MADSEQALIARVLDLFAQRFAKRAVLRGGMVLRILGSPRFTNDLDYVFVPYKSKKDLVPEVLACLQSIEGATISHSFNSKCLRVVLTVGGTTIQIEAKAAMTTRTSMASTRAFAREFNLPPRMVCIVDHTVALANTLAAWNERRLIRDLYDIWFFLQMGIAPDRKTLESRLRRPDYSRLVSKKDRFPGSTASDFYEFIRLRASTLTDAEIGESLTDYLPPDEIGGLAMQIRAALTKLR